MARRSAGRRFSSTTNAKPIPKVVVRRTMVRPRSMNWYLV